MEILRLKAILMEKGMTGKDLSKKVGVSTVAISNIASGNSFPKPDLLIKIAKELDVDVRELFYPTKEDEARELIYIQKDGQYINIGELKIE